MTERTYKGSSDRGREVNKERNEMKNQAAVELGKLGGSVKSERKAKTSAENGKKGGRPVLRYDVIVNREGVLIELIPDCTEKEAVKIAERKSAENLNADVFITWFRKSDGQRGYLNPNGDHAITGTKW